MKRKINIFLVVIILVASLYLMAMGFIPPRREVILLPLLPPGGMPSLPGERVIRLEYAPEMRTGETQIIELNLSKRGDPGETSIYQEYDVFMEARLDLPLADVRPENLVTTTMAEDGSATYYWEVNPRQAGELSGTVWLYLHLISKQGGSEFRKPAFAYSVEIHPRQFWGLNGSGMRLAGIAGLILGIAVSLPLFVMEKGK